MPTGENQRNPRGLMQAARESRERITQVHRQVDDFLARLAEEPDLAEPLDDAVRREDRDAVVEVLRKGGLDGEIKIDHLEADRRYELTYCAILGAWACLTVAVDW